jgi:hypothetical protein
MDEDAPATQDVTRRRTFMAHAGTVPGGGSPANMALPDAQRRPSDRDMAMTQGQLLHNAESRL